MASLSAGRSGRVAEWQSVVQSLTAGRPALEAKGLGRKGGDWAERTARVTLPAKPSAAQLLSILELCG